MLFRIAICLFIVSIFWGCSKESKVKPYGFLSLRFEGQDEEVKWEAITASWQANVGSADMEATGFNFEKCTIHLRNIFDTGSISPVTRMQFYYTDGIDLIPIAVSGTLSITEVSDKIINGTFDLSLRSNDSSERKVIGEFGIVDP